MFFWGYKKGWFQGYFEYEGISLRLNLYNEDGNTERLKEIRC